MRKLFRLLQVVYSCLCANFTSLLNNYDLYVIYRAKANSILNQRPRTDFCLVLALHALIMTIVSMKAKFSGARRGKIWKKKCTFHLSSHMHFAYPANFNLVNTLIISLKKCHWYILYLLHIVARGVSAQGDSIVFEAKQEDDNNVLPFVIGFMKTSIIQCSPLHSHEVVYKNTRPGHRLPPRAQQSIHWEGQLTPWPQSVQAGATGAFEQTTGNIKIWGQLLPNNQNCHMDGWPHSLLPTTLV